jgi:hypothetical protein
MGEKFTMTKVKSHKKPERGGLLTAAIVFVIIHGLLILGVALAENNADAPNWFYPTLGILAIVDIVAGIMLWRWKILGLYLYLATTIAIIIVALIATGSLGVAFSRIVPFAIVGYIVMPKRKYFT